MDTSTGEVLGRVQVGAIPRGLALISNADGAPTEAWVLNALENSVSLVNLDDVANPKLDTTIQLVDPTDPMLKLGRILFNDANASSSETFACAGCHPDGHTDQLLWVLDTPM
jgi:cytochrome c peroxidase